MLVAQWLQRRACGAGRAISRYVSWEDKHTRGAIVPLGSATSMTSSSSFCICCAPTRTSRLSPSGERSLRICISSVLPRKPVSHYPSTSRAGPLLLQNRRVLFVNVDGWHCSGVEEAFYTTDRVLSISLHRYAEGSFPGSGGMGDIGGGKGKHYNINLPVADVSGCVCFLLPLLWLLIEELFGPPLQGLDDEGFTSVLQPVVAAAAARFCPHCVVVCAGAGVVSGDRLGCLNVSVAAHAAFLKELMSLDLPLLVLGGGGYSQLNAARVW